jgi:tight adherence protein B
MTMYVAALNVVDLVLVAAVFALVLALWLAGVFVAGARRQARSRRVESRLAVDDEVGAGTRVLRLWRDGEESTMEVPGVRRRSFGDRLERINIEADLNVPIQTLILGVLAISLIVSVPLLLYLRTPVPGIAVGAGLIWLLVVYVKRRSVRRLERFETQFVDALDLAARSLRAGHPLMGAFRLISEEIAAPVGQIFGDVCQQQALGSSLEQALRRTSDQHPSGDFKLFATSVVIQMRSGGNLADMMERIAFVIRDRMRLSRRVRVLTAQTQLSKRILLVLPIIVFFVLHLINAKYMATFYTTYKGQVLLAIAGGSMLLGAWIMSKLLVIKY